MTEEEESFYVAVQESRDFRRELFNILSRDGTVISEAKCVS